MIPTSSLKKVQLSQIEFISPATLDQKKLLRLKTSTVSLGDTFSGYVNAFTQKTSDPIVLDNSRTPYTITNGRHRIYLAREQGLKEVIAYLQKKTR